MRVPSGAPHPAPHLQPSLLHPRAAGSGRGHAAHTAAVCTLRHPHPTAQLPPAQRAAEAGVGGRSRGGRAGREACLMRRPGRDCTKPGGFQASTASCRSGVPAPYSPFSSAGLLLQPCHA